MCPEIFFRIFNVPIPLAFFVKPDRVCITYVVRDFFFMQICSFYHYLGLVNYGIDLRAIIPYLQPGPGRVLQ